MLSVSSSSTGLTAHVVGLLTATVAVVSRERERLKALLECRKLSRTSSIRDAGRREPALAGTASFQTALGSFGSPSSQASPFHFNAPSWQITRDNQSVMRLKLAFLC
uniref:Uncharacterized protein n=1 Tax=Arundo donax TaxID=35708 RepID=A0A0A9DR34_ARUDO